MEYVGGGSARDLVSLLYYCVFLFSKTNICSNQCSNENTVLY